MAYLQPDADGLLSDINSRKEFRAFGKNPRQSKFLPDVLFDVNELSRDHIHFMPYQNFISNFIHPNTPYPRLYVKWETGTGKTLGSFAVAKNFIEYYKKSQLEVGSIFVVGFSEKVFKTELLTRPELGFVSREEVKSIHRLRYLASSGSASDAKKLLSLTTKIKKRFGNRKRGGYFKFVGYKALVNRVFVGKVDISHMNMNDIMKNVEDGLLKVDTGFLAQFENSLIICDEIHNVYNSMEKNNWGSALQYILDNVPSVRAIFLSATPLGNSPTEIVDLLNLVVPRSSLKKSDLFADGKLKKGALDTIRKLIVGRVSFLMDSDPAYFPSKRLLGTSIKGIDYLKFIRCQMSKFHAKTYDANFTGSLSQDSQYLNDIALPDPKSDGGIFKTESIRSIALASPEWKARHKIDFKGRLVGDFAKVENLEKYSSKYHRMITDILSLMSRDSGKIFIYHNIVHISGILLIEEILLRNGIIGENSSITDSTRCVVCGKTKKSHKMKGGSARLPLGEFEEEGTNIYPKGGDQPVLSYSNEEDRIFVRSGDVDWDSLDISWLTRFNKPIVFQVHDSHGVKVLKGLGFHIRKEQSTDGVLYKYMLLGEKVKMKPRRVEYDELPESEGGCCSAVGGGKSEEHQFVAARYVIAHSEVDKSKMFNSMEKFNAPNNTMGHKYLIIVGAKMIKESYNFKAIQHMMIMGRPHNIPTLKQIFGRAIRKDSHILLPPEMRTVNIGIYTSSGKTLTYDEQKYMKKMEDYKTIQKIETVFHENAIDASVNNDVINFSRKGDVLRDFNMNPFSPVLGKPKTIKMSTFNVFHAEKEVDIAATTIKRLFLETSTVWKYYDLFDAVKAPPFTTEMNSSMISEENFCIALTRLVYQESDKNVEAIMHHANSMDTMHDPHGMIIVLPNGQPTIIKHVGEFYMLIPMDDYPVMEPEACYRLEVDKGIPTIDVKKFLVSSADIFSYDEKKTRFFVKWAGASLSNLEPSVCDFGTGFHIKFIEECIEYTFNVWTEGIRKSPMHSFIFKMLQFYSIRELIAWQHTTKPFIAKLYEKFVLPVSEDIIQTQKTKIRELSADLSTSGIVNLLKSSINNSIMAWCPSELEKKYKIHLDLSLGKVGKRVKGKVEANFLPVGHFLGGVPRFYHPDKGWFSSPEYSGSSVKYRENDIIIGMDVRQPSSVNTKFKMRLPKHKASKFRDKRKILKGSVCSSSKSKGYLLGIAKQIGAEVDNKSNVISLCSLIRERLIYLELKERIAKSDIKYFWFHYESDGKLENI